MHFFQLPHSIPLNKVKIGKQIRKYLIPKMDVRSDHVLVKFDMEKRVKNISCFVCKPMGASVIDGLSLCQLIAGSEVGTRSYR